MLTNINGNEADNGSPRGDPDTSTAADPNKNYTAAANILVPNYLPARRNTFSEVLRRVRGLDPGSGSRGRDSSTTDHGFLRLRSHSI